MQETLNIPRWQVVLEQCLLDLKTTYSRLSDVQIANKINIPTSTFSRMNKEMKRPQLETLLKLIVGSGNTHRLSEAMEDFDADIAKILEKAKESTKNIGHKHLKRDVETLFQNSDVYITYLLSLVQGGVSLDRLINVLGNSAHQALKVLQESELIIFNGSAYKALTIENFQSSFALIHRHLPSLVKFYKPEHIGRRRNYIQLLTEGMNADGVIKLQALHEEYYQKALTLMRAQENKGSIPMFHVALCDSFTRIDDEINENEVRAQGDNL